MIVDVLIEGLAKRIEQISWKRVLVILRSILLHYNMKSIPKLRAGNNWSSELTD